MQESSNKPFKGLLIYAWKVAGVLHRLNGITQYSNRLIFRLKQTLSYIPHLDRSGCDDMHRRGPNFVDNLAPIRWSNIWLILSSGYRFLMITAFNPWQSTYNYHPAFWQTKLGRLPAQWMVASILSVTCLWHILGAHPTQEMSICLYSDYGLLHETRCQLG